MSGLSSKALAFGTSEKKLKYNGKEEQKAEFSDGSGLDWLDYGARMYDAQIGRWSVVDPMADKYSNISPYVYCVNNPLIFIDPTGMVIDDADQKKYDRMQKKVEKKQRHLDNRLNRLIKRDGPQEKIKKISERVNQLSVVTETLKKLESSPIMYQLNALDGNVASEGYLSYNRNANNGGGAVVINYIKGSISNFVHESAHAGQFESREIAFANGNNANNTIGIDLYDEALAYRAQFAYSPKSVSRITSNANINGMNDITTDWVFNIHNQRTNAHPYQATYVGRLPVNTGTILPVLKQAYPGISFMGNSPIVTLQQLFPNIIQR